MTVRNACLCRIVPSRFVPDRGGRDVAETVKSAVAMSSNRIRTVLRRIRLTAVLLALLAILVLPTWKIATDYVSSSRMYTSGARSISIQGRRGRGGMWESVDAIVMDGTPITRLEQRHIDEVESWLDQDLFESFQYDDSPITPGRVIEVGRTWHMGPALAGWSSAMLRTSAVAFCLLVPLFILTDSALYLRRQSGRCPECDYDLRGSSATGCPECGWARCETSE